MALIRGNHFGDTFCICLGGQVRLRQFMDKRRGPSGCVLHYTL